MMEPRRHESERPTSGFTLIEVMIVVAIVAVLASVATVAYRNHIRSGRLVSGRAFIAQIQAAQETYFQQWGRYCDASGAGTSATGSYHPALVASGEPTAKPWAASLPAGFKDLGVQPDGGNTYLSVFVHASTPTLPTNHALIGAAATLGIPAQPAAPNTPHPWYYIVAHADLDGSGSSYSNGGCTGGVSASECTVLTATNVQSAIVVRNEGK